MALVALMYLLRAIGMYLWLGSLLFVNDTFHCIATQPLADYTQTPYIPHLTQPLRPYVQPSPLFIFPAHPRKECCRYHPTVQWVIPLSSPIRHCAVSQSANRPLYSSYHQQLSSMGNQTILKCNGKMDLLPPRGTRDFYPNEMRQRNWLFNKWHSISNSFGFEQYDTPIVEKLALYQQKTNSLRNQLYSFEDKSGRSLALRPEMTPSLARIIKRKGNSISFPFKWFSLAQCWRYERKMKCRNREHYQWNMDIIGVSEVDAEAELLAALVSFLKNVSLTSTDISIHINSKGVLQSILRQCEIPLAQWETVYTLIDKWKKIPMDKLRLEFSLLKLENVQIDRLFDIMLSVSSFESLCDVLGKEDASVLPLRKLLELAEAYGYKDWLVISPFTVRGLSYYTGIVFEAFDKPRRLRALCGGGRYDNMIKTAGNESIPAVGFGMGDASIMQLLSDMKKLPDISALAMQKNQITVWSTNSLCYKYAIDVASQLRRKGWNICLTPLQHTKAKTVFRKAIHLQSAAVVLIDEAFEKGVVTVKLLRDGKPRICKIEELGPFLNSVLQ